MSPHYQGLRVSQERNEHEEGSKKFLLACCWLFLIGLLLNQEDGGEIFPQNVG
jgi:hypothetical protein